MLERKRPAAIIFGAPRSGTTSLWRYLVAHPEIAASRTKELDYFAASSPREDYAESFAETGNVTLEASPVYFREHASIVPRLAAALPDARLICVLREPAARLVASFRGERDWQARIAPGFDFAQYARIVAEDASPLPINPSDPAVAQYVKDGSKVGIYADILQHYLEHYAPDQILVLFLDDLKSQPEQVVRQCCAHIGVDPDRLPPMDYRAENQGVNIKSARLFRVLRRVNLALEPLLNRIPALRRVLKRLHNTINGAPADLHADAEAKGKEILRGFYAPHNVRLERLLAKYFPDIDPPGWVKEASGGRH